MGKLLKLAYTLMIPWFAGFTAYKVSGDNLYWATLGVILGITIKLDNKLSTCWMVAATCLFFFRDIKIVYHVGAIGILVVHAIALVKIVKLIPLRLRKNKGSTGVDVTNSQTFYNSHAWRRLRLRVFEKYGHVCMVPGCNNKGNHVDHIRPRSLYPHLALDFNNLQVLCGPCNRAKSNDVEVDFRGQAVS